MSVLSHQWQIQSGGQRIYKVKASTVGCCERVCVWLEVNCGRRPVLHLSLPERPPSPLGPSPSWCGAVEGLDVGRQQLSPPFTPSCSLLWSSHLINSHCTSHWNFPFSIFCHSPRQPIPPRPPRPPRPPSFPPPPPTHTASLAPTTRQVVP